jgi:hypothetical protein
VLGDGQPVPTPTWTGVRVQEGLYSPVTVPCDTWVAKISTAVPASWLARPPSSRSPPIQPAPATIHSVPHPSIFLILSFSHFPHFLILTLSLTLILSCQHPVVPLAITDDPLTSSYNEASPPPHPHPLNLLPTEHTERRVDLAPWRLWLDSSRPRAAPLVLSEYLVHGPVPPRF